MRVCVMLVVLSDRRLFDALDSLRIQRRRPDRVLVADGGSSPDYRAEVLRRGAGLPLEVAEVPGLPAESREAVLDRIQEEITAFLDADEVAPPEWLEALVAPIESGAAEFVGGPTRPSRPPQNSIERYHAEIERKIYEEDIVRSVQYLPLGNSAWKTSILQELRFDTRVRFAEDFDIAGRAMRRGARGLYVPAAWVFHNKTVEASFPQLFRKRYIYLVQAACVFLRDRNITDRLGEKRTPLRHPLGWVEEWLLKPVAVMHAYLRLRWGAASTPFTPPARNL